MCLETLLVAGLRVSRRSWVSVMLTRQSFGVFSLAWTLLGGVVIEISLWRVSDSQSTIQKLNGANMDSDISLMRRIKSLCARIWNLRLQHVSHTDNMCAHWLA